VSEQDRNEYGADQTADLSQENLRRVAASAIQIRGVLVKDEGLMVELKRWVAKESTDNGQVVEDSKLTDQAIFDRLERDVAFRSVATRLLQRYGYLVPTTNPDSDFAKEKQLVLQERARRLVQIEAQEDSESLRPQKNDRDLDARGPAIRAAIKIVCRSRQRTAKILAFPMGCPRLRRILRRRQSKHPLSVSRKSCERWTAARYRSFGRH